MTKKDISDLFNWQAEYENFWHKHDDLDYLKSFDFPQFGKSVDDFDSVVESIIRLIEKQKDYVHQHTNVLLQAMAWQKHQCSSNYLPVGKERQAIERWLLTEFTPPKQPPCIPTVLQCDFICDARKNAENRQTDVFICYDTTDKVIRNMVIHSMSRFIITTWTHDKDIQKGTTFEQAIEEGIEQASNFFFFISPYSVKSEYCLKELAHAQKFNKRIIPLLVIPTEETEIPEILKGLQYIDFTDNKEQADYDKDIDDILNILREEENYFEEHKILLVRALKWKLENQKLSFLLRGHNLDNAQTWLRLNQKRTEYPPTELHKEFIFASEAAKGQLSTDVFISYSRKDGDFARNLNTKLQEAGKMTWFDQESISTGVDFEKEIFKGIEGADNFLFVISPDAVESEYCEREVEYAKSLNKRFMTLLCRDVDVGKMPEALRIINWIDFKEKRFEESFGETIQTIELDREHSHQHTLLQRQAMEWNDNQRIEDFLLNKTAYDTAHLWLEEALEQEKKPIPTELQKSYILDSQRAIEAMIAKEKATTRNRRRFFAFIFILAIATLGAIFFGWQAKTSQIEAESEKLKAQTAEKRALNEKVKADSARVLSEEAEKTAKEAEKQAINEKKEADEAREKAKQEEVRANQAKASAERSEAAAKVSEERAKESAEEAKKAKNRAEKSEKDAKFNLYWFNAKNFALMSDLHEDPNEKAWLALAAYDLSKAGYDSMNLPEKYSTEILQALQNAALAYDQKKGMLLPRKSEISTIYSDVDKEGKILYFDGSHKEIVMAQLDAGDALNEESLTVEKTFSLHEDSHVRAICSTESGIFYGTLSGKLKKLENDRENYIFRFSEPIQSIRSIPHRNLVSAFSKNTLVLIDNEDVDTLNSIQRINQAVIGDDKDLMIADDFGKISHIHLEGKYKDTEIFKHKYSIKSIAYNQARKILAIGDTRGNLRLIQLKTDGTYKVLNTQYLPRKHGGHVTDLAFSPNSRFLASAGLDGMVMLWDLAEMQNNLEGIFKLTPVIYNQEKIFVVAFDKESKFLIYGGQQQLHLRPIKIDTIYDRLRNYMKKENLFAETHADNLWRYYNKGLAEDAKPHPEK